MQLALNHPKGLYYLFFAEMWERFSYYGMRVLLVLFMTQELLLGDKKAYLVYGAFTAFVYMTTVMGGYLADKYLGYVNAVKIGGWVIMVGHIVLALPSSAPVALYTGLAFIIVGTGFFKSNISAMVGILYPEGDNRRDSGFTLYYMGVNLGSFLASLIVAAVGSYLGWHYGFSLAAIGMACGMITFSRAEKKAVFPIRAQTLQGAAKYVIAGSLVSIILFVWLLANVSATKTILAVFGIVVLVYFIGKALLSPAAERKAILYVLFLSFISMMFWASFEQAGSSLFLFIERMVDREALGIVIPTGNFKSLNPLFIILFAPLVAWLWSKLPPLGALSKFGLALLLISAGFMVFALGAESAMGGVKVSILIIVIGYFLNTMGEICLSPVGLSEISRVSPPKIVGMMFGGWFLATAFANYLAGLMATHASIEKDTPLHLAAGIYHELFAGIALSTAISGTVVLLIAMITKIIRRQKVGG